MPEVSEKAEARPTSGGVASFLRIALQLVTLLLLLTLTAGMAALILAVGSLVGLPGRTAESIGGRVGSAASDAARGVSEAARSLRDAADPAHPPTGFTYDQEYVELRVVGASQPIAEPREYSLILKEVRRREGAPTPDTALYAVGHAELRSPRETRILGQLVRSDSDPRDHVLYKGELFRIGRAIFRVNWVSLEQGRMAVLSLRTPDTVTGALKFEYE